MRVYCLLNKINGKVYIGKTQRNDAVREHEHFKFALEGKAYCPYLYKAIRLYGKKSFEVCLLSGFAFSISDLNAQEMHYIQKYRANEPEFGYNLTSGGDGLFNPSVEVRQKMSLGKLGKKQSLETIAKRSKAMMGNKNCLGRTQSVEERQMRSLVSPYRGIPLSENQKKHLSLRNSGNGGRVSVLGKRCIHNPITQKEKLVRPEEVDIWLSVGWAIGASPGHCAKNAKTKIGRAQSRDTVEKRAARIRGTKRTEETKRRMSDAAKRRGVPMEHICLMVQKQRDKKASVANV